MSLAVPLSMDQIEAAKSLHSRLPQWAATDRALHLLSARFPGFDIDSTLLKVAAINQLYFTNVYAVPRMAHHITGVMSGAGSGIRPYELVERIAALPKTKTQKNERRHTSFASKFAHFFIDTVQFPIYDSYAERMLSYHLGRRSIIRDKDRPYRAFIENLKAIGALTKLPCTGRELDRYLWLAGLYQAWRINKESPINAEVARMFEEASPEIIAELNRMLPPELSRD